MKRLRQCQYAIAQDDLTTHPGGNPYTALAGPTNMLHNESTQETRESWEPYNTTEASDFPPTGEMSHETQEFR